MSRISKTVLPTSGKSFIYWSVLTLSVILLVSSGILVIDNFYQPTTTSTTGTSGITTNTNTTTPITGFTSSTTTSSTTITNSSTTTTEPDLYTNYTDSISIDGNTEMGTFENKTGTGTYDDPFVIEWYRFLTACGGSPLYALINIQNVDNLIIQNCIFNAICTTSYIISLNNCENITIYNNLAQIGYGIIITNTNEINITSNILNSAKGITISNFMNLTIINNIINITSTNIFSLTTGNNSLIENNYIRSDVDDNGYFIGVNHSLFKNNDILVRFTNLNGENIENENITFQYNYFTKILNIQKRITDLFIMYNYFDKESYDYPSIYNLALNFYYHHNTIEGYAIFNGNDALIYQNNFYYQAQSQGYNNVTFSYNNLGNWWDDYDPESYEPDATNDGTVWDTPYYLDNAGEYVSDPYPLVNAVNVSNYGRITINGYFYFNLIISGFMGIGLIYLFQHHRYRKKI